MTRIMHDGFLLSDSGRVEASVQLTIVMELTMIHVLIDNASLAYHFKEYLGELYRMDLSCSDGGLPESGCLFFKVVGETNITAC